MHHYTHLCFFLFDMIGRKWVHYSSWTQVSYDELGRKVDRRWMWSISGGGRYWRRRSNQLRRILLSNGLDKTIVHYHNYQKISRSRHFYDSFNLFLKKKWNRKNSTLSCIYFKCYQCYSLFMFKCRVIYVISNV